ncbi:MAG: hypothetical protein QG623_462 [Patescibacteria group bacterium]|nr:hypothetical protein [Patescibacteria group bacterium]
MFIAHTLTKAEYICYYLGIMDKRIAEIVRLSDDIPSEEPYRSTLLNRSGLIEWHQLYTTPDREGEIYTARPDLPRLAHSRSSINGVVYPSTKGPSAIRNLARAAGLVKGHDIILSKDFAQVSTNLRIYRDLLETDWEMAAYFRKYWFEGVITIDGTPYEFSPDMSVIKATIGKLDWNTGGISSNNVSFRARPHLEEVTSTGEPKKLWDGQQPLPIVDFGDSNEDNMIRVLEVIAAKSRSSEDTE